MKPFRKGWLFYLKILFSKGIPPDSYRYLGMTNLYGYRTFALLIILANSPGRKRFT